MGMGSAPTWLRQVSPLLHTTTLTTAPMLITEKNIVTNNSLLLIYTTWATFGYIPRNRRTTTDLVLASVDHSLTRLATWCTQYSLYFCSS